MRHLPSLIILGYSLNMYEGTLVKLTVSKHKVYKAHFLVNYDGIEEESSLQYNAVDQIPQSFLVKREDGSLGYRQGMKVAFRSVHEDAQGITFYNLVE